MATKIKKNEEIQVVDYRYDEGVRVELKVTLVLLLLQKIVDSAVCQWLWEWTGAAYVKN